MELASEEPIVELASERPVAEEVAAPVVPRQPLSSSTMIGLGTEPQGLAGQAGSTPSPAVEIAPAVEVALVTAPPVPAAQPIDATPAPEPSALPVDALTVGPRPPLATCAGLGPWQQAQPELAPQPPAARGALGSITQVDAVPPGSLRAAAQVDGELAAPPAPDSRPELSTIVDEGPWPASLEVDLERLTPWPGRPAASYPEAPVAPVDAPSCPADPADVAAHWPVAAPVAPPESVVAPPTPSNPDGTDLLPPVWSEPGAPELAGVGMPEMQEPRASSPNETLRMDPLDEEACRDETADIPADSPSHSRSIAPLTLSEPFELEPPPRRAQTALAAVVAALVTAAAFVVAGGQQTMSPLELGMRAPAAVVVLCPHAEVASVAGSSEDRASPEALTDPAPDEHTPVDKAPNEKTEPAQAAASPAAAPAATPSPARARRPRKASSQWLSQVHSEPSKKKTAKKKRSTKRQRQRGKR